jgi:hypothetical protein
MALASTRTTHVRQFRACQLAWRFTAVEQVPVKTKANLELGTLVHRELETWWLRGLMPQRPMVRAVVPVLQALLAEIGVAPGQGLAEWNFRISVGGIIYGGQSDLVLVTPAGEVWVIDYKTSSNVDAWGLTDQQLAQDTQLGVYASQVLLQLAPGAPGAHVAHVQIETFDAGGHAHDHPDFTPRVELVRSWMSRETTLGIWAKVSRTVDQMKEVATLPLQDVPGNTEHCQMYGGCVYRTRCPVYAKGQAARKPAAHFQEDKPMTMQYPPAPAYQPPPQPFWLLIDTAPEIGAGGLPQPVYHVDQVLGPLQQQVAAEAGVPWYTMLDFGQGPARVVAKLAMLQLSGTCIVDSMTPCGQAVVEHLRPRAAVVLRRSR